MYCTYGHAHVARSDLVYELISHTVCTCQLDRPVAAASCATCLTALVKQIDCLTYLVYSGLEIAVCQHILVCRMLRELLQVKCCHDMRGPRQILRTARAAPVGDIIPVFLSK